MKSFDKKIVFLLCLLIAGSGFLTPPIALVGGVVFAFLVAEHPMRAESARLSKVLLQASVVLLGFGMDVHQVMRAGKAGFAYTAIGLACALLLGTLIGKLLRVAGRASFLITVGTAICGGSAIAAVAPVLEATEEEISVAMGTVFLLNSIALVLFPVIGHAMALGQTQFGLWAALAIHDTSSVVGAGAAYGAQALAVGTTVKLARALWIVPVSLGDCGGSGAEEQRREGEGCRAVVHWAVLRRCGDSYATAGVWACLHRTDFDWQNRSDGDAVPDWQRTFEGDAAQGGCEAAGAGRGAVADCGNVLAGGDSRGMDCVVR